MEGRRRKRNVYTLPNLVKCIEKLRGIVKPGTLKKKQLSLPPRKTFSSSVVSLNGEILVRVLLCEDITKRHTMPISFLLVSATGFLLS